MKNIKHASKPWSLIIVPKTASKLRIIAARPWCSRSFGQCLRHQLHSHLLVHTANDQIRPKNSSVFDVWKSSRPTREKRVPALAHRRQTRKGVLPTWNLVPIARQGTEHRPCLPVPIRHHQCREQHQQCSNRCT